MSEGKKNHMKALSNAAGVIAAAAMDQRLALAGKAKPDQHQARKCEGDLK